METIRVNSKEFRSNQKTFLDKVEEGAKLILQRGEHYFMIVSLHAEEFVLSDEAIKRIEESRKQLIEGRIKTFESQEESRKFLESL